MAVIRGTALLNFHRLVGELGGDSHELVNAARIPYDDVGRHDRFISLADGIRLLEAAAVSLRAPDFGRQLARRQGIEILGPVGLAARNAGTVADAFVIFDTYMAAYSPAIRTRMAIDQDPQLYRFEFEFLLRPDVPQAQAIELSLGVTLRVLHLFLGGNYRPVAVHLPHSPLTPETEYQRYFGCPPSFCDPVAGFTVRTIDLQRSLPTDHLAHQTALDYLTDMIGDHYPETAELVCRLVRQLLPTGTVTLPAIARLIGLHPKTLQRRLAAEHTTFAALVDQTRRDTARRLLVDTTISIDQLCRQLGYTEQSVLTRACHRWFGTTPTAYRTAAREQNDIT